MPGKVSCSVAIMASSTPWARAVVKLSITSASRPLIITLRHILVAEATPTRSLTTVARMPSAVSSGNSADACGPPINIGTPMPCGGTEVITPASTYRPPAASISAAACCLVPGEAEFRSRKKAPAFRWSAASCATASVLDAVTAEITSCERWHRSARLLATRSPWSWACDRTAASENFRSQALTDATCGSKAAEKMRPTSPWPISPIDRAQGGRSSGFTAATRTA